MSLRRLLGSRVIWTALMNQAPCHEEVGEDRGAVLRKFNLGTSWRRVVNSTQPAVLPGIESVVFTALEAY
jgi:hypothetical protein